MSRIRADKFVDRAATGAPELTQGVNFGASGVGGTITAAGQAEFLVFALHQVFLVVLLELLQDCLVVHCSGSSTITGSSKYFSGVKIMRM